MNETLDFQVVIDPKADSKVCGVVAFGDFESVDGSAAIYRDYEAQEFYNDLILGRPLPLVFVTRKLSTVGSVVAITLFLHRDLAIHPRTVEVVASARLVDMWGIAGFAHIDRDLARFFHFLAAYIPAQISQDVLSSVVGWVRAYILEGSLPSLPPEKEPPRLLDRGTNGFVVATTSHGDLPLGWEELYRAGFLRGVLFQQFQPDRWRVLGARKSAYLEFDLEKASVVLNEAEKALGELSEWVSDGLWLRGPEEGTLLLPSAIIKLLLKV